MKITHLGQGFESESKNSVGNTIIKLFKEKKFSSFTGISAFASEAGIAGLSECITSGIDYYKTLNLIVGVDQEGTSLNALNEIDSLGINSYIFYQKEQPIFHPKIYLFEGKNDIALIVGSSNLTVRGFFSNIESSLLIEFSKGNENGEKLLSDLKNHYKTLFDFTDSNLFKINPQTIQGFVDEGIVPTQRIWNRKHRKNTSERVPKERNKLTIPKRPTSKIPNEFKGRYKNNRTLSRVIAELEIQNDFEFINENNELVWESEELSERDLSIPRNKVSNPTYSMGLKKGKTKNIDQRHYFREEVFKKLNWSSGANKRYPHLEKTETRMRIIILGIDYGIFNITISHNPKTDTKTYEQGNFMTEIKWGDAKHLISQDELIDKTANLYRSKIEPDYFTLIIK